MNPATNHAIIDSPIGPLTLVRSGPHLSALYMGEHRHAPERSTFGAEDPCALAEAITQINEYFSGQRTTFELTLEAAGTPFQREVWAALAAIPYGETRSYAQIAADVGRPTAFRAVGLANGRNPISIVVPCHRVIGASGALTGYGGGLERKAALLAHERRVLAVNRARMEPGAGARTSG